MAWHWYSAKTSAAMPALAVRPLTEKNWDDIETLFAAKGCSIPRWCWCVHYRFAHAAMPKDRKAALKKLAKNDPPPGLIAYRGKTPVGWISLGPREDFAKLATSPIMKPVDDKPVWSIICFVVPTAERGQGIARALLDGAITYARKRKVKLLEAYPIDKKGASTPMSIWFGTASMFAKKGFTEAARRKPTRPVMRLALT
jgi:GNAT superfamily N-acetyltransferase